MSIVGAPTTLIVPGNNSAQGSTCAPFAQQVYVPATASAPFAAGITKEQFAQQVDKLELEYFGLISARDSSQDHLQGQLGKINTACLECFDTVGELCRGNAQQQQDERRGPSAPAKIQTLIAKLLILETLTSTTHESYEKRINKVQNLLDFYKENSLPGSLTQYNELLSLSPPNDPLVGIISSVAKKLSSEDSSIYFLQLFHRCNDSEDSVKLTNSRILLLSLRSFKNLGLETAYNNLLEKSKQDLFKDKLIIVPHIITRNWIYKEKYIGFLIIKAGQGFLLDPKGGEELPPFSVFQHNNQENIIWLIKTLINQDINKFPAKLEDYMTVFEGICFANWNNATVTFFR